MCLAYPMKILEIKQDTCTAYASGIKREVNIQMIDNLKVGDYVIVHAGFAIQKLNKKDAQENIKIIDELNAKLSNLSG